MFRLENVKTKCTGIVDDLSGPKGITSIVHDVQADIAANLKEILKSMNT